MIQPPLVSLFVLLANILSALTVISWSGIVVMSWCLFRKHNAVSSAPAKQAHVSRVPSSLDFIFEYALLFVLLLGKTFLLVVVAFDCPDSKLSALSYVSERVPEMTLSAMYDAERPMSAAGTSFVERYALKDVINEDDDEDKEKKEEEECNGND